MATELIVVGPNNNNNVQQSVRISQVIASFFSTVCPTPSPFPPLPLPSAPNLFIREAMATELIVGPNNNNVQQSVRISSHGDRADSGVGVGPNDDVQGVCVLPNHPFLSSSPFPCPPVLRSPHVVPLSTPNLFIREAMATELIVGPNDSVQGVTPNLFIREAMATELIVGPNDDVQGVRTFFGVDFLAKAVVLTTGTFMNGRIWVGRQSLPAGRAGEGASHGLTEYLLSLGFDLLPSYLFSILQSLPAGRAGEGASHGLTEYLLSLGFESDRLKTGTPPRIDIRTVDFSRLEEQPGDDPEADGVGERWFSFDESVWRRREQMSCWLTRTTAETHRLVEASLHETPTYGGWVDGRGPRYCPSIEDKIVRFKDKESHQIFLEPEGRTVPELYVQGFSTGLPERLQLALLRSLPGLERCSMLRPAYAVEYDYLPAYQCQRTLMTKKIEGLFFSGQINGTTGYEEAAAQIDGTTGGYEEAAAQVGRIPVLILFEPPCGLRGLFFSGQINGTTGGYEEAAAQVGRIPVLILFEPPCGLRGLFFSGQINGTTGGYEEAAAQGLIAGMNAARLADGKLLIALERESSYIGTLIDDLVTKDLREPYRMLTSPPFALLFSRSEFRLLLRSDNADVRLTPMGREIGLINDRRRSEFRLLLRSDNADVRLTPMGREIGLIDYNADVRLTPMGREIGLIDDRRWGMYLARQARMDAEKERLKRYKLAASHPAIPAIEELSGAVRHGTTLDQILRRPHVTYRLFQDLNLMGAPTPLSSSSGSESGSDSCLESGSEGGSGPVGEWGEGGAVVSAWEAECVEVELKYEGFIQRQKQQLEQVVAKEHRRIPEDIDYDSIATVSKEAREKLSKIRPATIGQASRLGGVNPADITALLIFLEVQRRKKQTANGTMPSRPGGVVNGDIDGDALVSSEPAVAAVNADG
ncbi:unnamed protein product [Closterium sp. NIES-64]|nr:unnamed protein product [Closterium sp. NIES-64]